MSWSSVEERLAIIARLQLFFVGGAPRSGTTWLQQMLNAHPEVSCRGEGLLEKHLAAPLEALMASRAQNLAAKNTALFQHTGGYPLPTPEDTEHLIGTGVLLAFLRQGIPPGCRAVGEKTPENVFTFGRMKKLFPHAKFIGIARDPRDVLASAWHFFNKEAALENDTKSKHDFIRNALPSLNQGNVALLELSRQFPADAATVTYEALLDSPEATLTRLFTFLGLSATPEQLSDCLTQTSFSAQTGGRSTGTAQNGAFLRNGRAGGWQSVLSPEMNDLVLETLGWSFPHFGWQG